LTNLIVPLEYHDSHSVAAFIGKAQVKTGDMFFTADFQRPALKSQSRPTTRIVEDLDVPPPDPFAHSQTNGFRESFLGCESERKRGGWVGSLETEIGFLLSEHPFYKTISPPLEHSLQTLDIYKINADAVDHGE
jgi:hypothetical protein